MAKNSLNRDIPDDKKAFVSSDDYRQYSRRLIPEKALVKKPIFFSSLEAAFLSCEIQPGMTLSFHHHLRSGDQVINQVADLILKYGLRNLTLAPSSIFPEYRLGPLIENNHVTKIVTSYLNGPVADIIASGRLAGDLVMQTHGGRARAIESGELPIDVAFIACPAVDRQGNGSGAFGKSACGTLGYALSDCKYAKKVILVTDTIVDQLEHHQLNHEYVDGVAQVDSIGDPAGIVAGTTKITRDPIGLKIAADTATLLDELGVIRHGFSMQTGAGGTSLAVADAVKRKMVEGQIEGDFASGGITGYYVDMLEQGLFQKLYDVQCFDLVAVDSFRRNANHIGISASEYGNPHEHNTAVDNLDFVILGATEIDLDFNVNVTTDAFGKIIGGSGGHADTAHGAKITVITSTLTKARIPIIREHVRTITTPGSDVDVLVTERGIAINPIRTDLIDKLRQSRLNIMTIQALLDLTYAIAGKPKTIPMGERRIGYVEYRDGTLIDSLYGASR